MGSEMAIVWDAEIQAMSLAIVMSTSRRARARTSARVCSDHFSSHFSSCSQLQHHRTLGPLPVAAASQAAHNRRPVGVLVEAKAPVSLQAHVIVAVGLVTRKQIAEQC